VCTGASIAPVAAQQAALSPTLYNVNFNTPEELLSAYIQIASVSGNEGEAGRFLANYCREKGLDIRVFNDSDSSYNFAASLYPLSTGKPNIVLLHHIDVVPAGDPADWTHPPYSGAIDSTHVWGRGAIDCKGQGVMQLMAMLDYVTIARHQALPYNVTLLSVSGEETGGVSGSKLITDFHLEELKPAVVFGEGGSGLTEVVPSKPEQQIFAVSIAEKSNMWLKLELKVPSNGHGAAPPDQYANKALLKALYKLNNVKTKMEFNKTNKAMFRQLGQLEGGVKGFALRHVHSPALRPFVKKYFAQEPYLNALVSNTVIVTNIYNPPGPPNQISNKATVLLDCRLLPGTNRKKFISHIKNGLFEPRFKVTVVDQSPEAMPSKPDKFYYAMEKAIKSVHPGAEVMPVLFPATTDNNYFRAKQIPVFGILPIIMPRELLETVHGPNERLGIAELHAGVETYKTMLRDLLHSEQKMEVVLP
jgi:carboxypeptidase PM20D1